MRHLAMVVAAAIFLACSARADLMQPDVKEVEQDVAAKASAANQAIRADAGPDTADAGR